MNWLQKCDLDPLQALLLCQFFVDKKIFIPVQNNDVFKPKYIYQFGVCISHLNLSKCRVHNLLKRDRIV